MRLASNKSRPSRVPKTSYYRGATNTTSQKASSRPVKTRARSVARRTGLIFLAIALLFAIGYSLMLSPTPKISLNSSVYHPATIYQTAADQLSQSLLNHNKLTYREKNIISSLQSKFPEIDRVSISLPIIGQRPFIKIDVAEPIFSLASANNKFLINQTGVIVERGNLNLSHLIPLRDESGLMPKEGEHLLSTDEVNFMEQVIAQAKSAHVNVESITMPAQAQEMDLHTLDSKYYVKFYVGGNPVLQSGQWLAARHQFSTKNITPSQYLDVRVIGKIYYK